MSTNEKPAAPVVPADDAERRAWFTQFGYTGDLDESVTLCGADGMPNVTAMVADVWTVLKGLLALEQDFNGQFHRVGNSAEDNRRPTDIANRLCRPEYGPLTDTQSGKWLPGRREIICCLLERNPDDDILFRLRQHPLVQKEEVAKAA